MKCECSLKDFCSKYPKQGSLYRDLLSDPDYIAKFILDKDGDLVFLEVGYPSDFWAIDNFKV